jgi:hypothetical protein
MKQVSISLPPAIRRMNCSRATGLTASGGDFNVNCSMEYVVRGTRPDEAGSAIAVVIVENNRRDQPDEE